MTKDVSLIEQLRNLDRWPPESISIHHTDDRGRPIRKAIADGAMKSVDPIITREKVCEWANGVAYKEAQIGPKQMRFAMKVAFPDPDDAESIEEEVLRWNIDASQPLPPPPMPAAPPPPAASALGSLLAGQPPPPMQTAVGQPALDGQGVVPGVPPGIMPDMSIYLADAARISAATTAQALGWADKCLALMLGNTERVFASQSAQIAALTTSLVEKEKINEQHTAEKIQLMLSEAQRQAETIKQTNESSWKQGLAQQFTEALPVVLSAIAGQRGVIARDPALAAFAGTLTEAQIGQLVGSGIFTEEQLKNLSVVLQQYMASRPPNGASS